MADEGTEAADLKVIETAAALRAVLLEEQEARELAAAAERKLLADQHRRERRVFVAIGAAVMALVLLFGAGGTVVLLRVAAVQEEIVECTKPGPETATRENGGRTGHDCYDEGRARTAEVVGQIVDADRNGRPDVVELREENRERDARLRRGLGLPP